MTLAITHKFVSAIADDPDATQVRPSNWNDTHAIALANQRVIGRVTAGDGAAEEVTASQLFDWISSTNGVLLTRTGGTWAGLANWSTDNGDLVANENTAPAAAPTGQTRVFGATVGGRGMLAAIGDSGDKQVLQPLLSRRAIAFFEYFAGGTTMSNIGMRHDVSGTPTARALANTNTFTRGKRMGYVSAATANAIASVRSAASWLSRATGFFASWRFGISDAALVGTSNMFVGWNNTTATDVDPSTLTNLVGVGCASGDTNLSIFAAGAAAQAKTSLGASFPVDTISTDVYEFTLYTPAGGASYAYELVRLNTGDRATGVISAAGALPSGTLLGSHIAWRSNGGTLAAVGLDMFKVYIETDL